MPSAPSDLERAVDLVDDGPDPQSVIRRSFIKGIAILLPLVVTLFVISFVLGFIYRQLTPIVGAVVQTGVVDSRVFVAIVTVLVFLLVVLVIGFLAEFAPGDHHLSDDLNQFMSSIPGVGSVYNSFNEMTELLLDSETDSFQEVKLVEYPGDDSYVVAFKTAETPDVIAEDTGTDDMITLFMPMAPNPVMGGFVIHVSRERVVDVDLTVEQGIRSIVTSGVAIGHNETPEATGEAGMRDFVDSEEGERVHRVDGTSLGQDDAASEEAKPPSGADTDG